MPEENPFENEKERQNPSNAVVAECYQTYDWLKQARAAADMNQFGLAHENLKQAHDSIQRAMTNAAKV